MSYQEIHWYDGIVEWFDSLCQRTSVLLATILLGIAMCVLILNFDGERLIFAIIRYAVWIVAIALFLMLIDLVLAWILRVLGLYWNLVFSWKKIRAEMEKEKREVPK